MIPEIGGDFMKWLRGFFFVAKTGSLAQAALEMERTQATISHQIRCLERQFGTLLFDRSGDLLKLTPEGEALLEQAVSIFESVKTMHSEVVERQVRPTGTVRVAATHAVVHNYLPSSILSIREKHPEVDLFVEGGGLEMILTRVESSEADFGLLNLTEVPKGFTYRPLFRTSPKLIAPANNPFGLSDRPPLEALEGVPFIFFPQTSTMARYIAGCFESQGMLPNVVLVLNNFNSVRHYVSLGMGVSIVDAFTLEDREHESLDVFDLAPPFEPREYGFLFRRKTRLTPAAKAFLQVIQPDFALS